MLKNIIKNALKPGFFGVMVDKVKKRITEPNPAEIKQKATAWYKERAINTEDWLEGIDIVLAKEAVEYNEALQLKGQKIIENLPVKMGGGGNVVLLYFLTRYLKPKVIVETGVSMGFSSQGFLSAIKKNGLGHLYSSDFPYFRIDNPEKYIGCVVDEDLKENWALYIEGDHKNLPAITQKVDSIDLFHYDSDKSYTGRNEALKLLEKQLNKATIVFDDIADNFHFKDFMESSDIPSVILQSPQGGYVGISANWLT